MSDPAKRAAESEVERLRELMPCGHPRACRAERLAPLWSGDPPGSTTDYCTACEREAALRKELAVAQALCFKLGAENCAREAAAVQAAIEDESRHWRRSANTASQKLGDWAKETFARMLKEHEDRLIASAYLAAREAVRGVAATDNGQRCLDRAELAIRALTPADARTELDRHDKEQFTRGREWELQQWRQHLEQHVERVVGQYLEALKVAQDALDSIWAAIGDALFSGKGIEKAYANSVAAEVRAAQKRIAELKAALEKTPAVVEPSKQP